MALPKLTCNLCANTPYSCLNLAFYSWAFLREVSSSLSLSIANSLLLDLCAFLLLFLSANIGVIDDDLIDLVLIVFLLEVDFFVESVQFFL